MGSVIEKLTLSSHSTAHTLNLNTALKPNSIVHGITVAKRALKDYLRLMGFDFPILQFSWTNVSNLSDSGLGRVRFDPELVTEASVSTKFDEQNFCCSSGSRPESSFSITNSLVVSTVFRLVYSCWAHFNLFCPRFLDNQPRQSIMFSGF